MSVPPDDSSPNAEGMEWLGDDFGPYYAWGVPPEDGGVDRGFCLWYDRLSYRRRFHRTLRFLAWAAIFLAASLCWLPPIWYPLPAVAAIAVGTGGFFQARHNLRAWRAAQFPEETR